MHQQEMADSFAGLFACGQLSGWRMHSARIREYAYKNKGAKSGEENRG